jgi:hypothetical protein
MTVRGGVRSAGIGNHPPRLGLVGSAGAVAAGGTVGPPALATALPVAGVAAVGTAGALVGQPVAAVGPADDRPGPGGGLAGPAFAVQLDDDLGAQGGVLLVAADPLVQLGRRPRPRRECLGLRATNTGSKLGVAGWPLRWRVAAMARWRTGFGVGGGHAQAVAGEGFAQRRPGGAQLGGGGVDAAKLLGQRVGPLSFGPVGEEAAGLPAQRMAIVPALLLRSPLDT